jgi:hypothetical protein
VIIDAPRAPQAEQEAIEERRGGRVKLPRCHICGKPVHPNGAGDRMAVDTPMGTAHFGCADAYLKS